MDLDLEDDPAGTTDRLKRMGVAREDIEKQFRYVRPEEPLASMQRNRFGSNATDDGIRNESVFKALLEAFDPTLILAVGMTVLYGLDGLDTILEMIMYWIMSCYTRYMLMRCLKVDVLERN